MKIDGPFARPRGLCQAFDVPRNVSNARIVTDLHDGVFDFISRPIGVTEPLGWLALTPDAVKALDSCCNLRFGD